MLIRQSGPRNELDNDQILFGTVNIEVVPDLLATARPDGFNELPPVELHGCAPGPLQLEGLCTGMPPD
jgi:hypothetical protein